MKPNIQPDDEFKQLVVDSVWKYLQGDPLEDFLSEYQIEQAVAYLSDIFIQEGFVPNTH